MEPVIYIFILLALLELAYILVARRFGIVDKPNLRSSHSRPIVRGGGIVFYFAVVAWFILSGCSDYLAFIAFTLLALISFCDDIHNIPVLPRLITQLISVGLLLWQMDILPSGIALWLSLLIIGTGSINAFNFMDGINGGVGLYSLLTLLVLYWINHTYAFIDSDLLSFSIIAAFIFIFLNFRRVAVCFAGDVGSILMGAIIFYATARLVLVTKNPLWFTLLAVYGVDTFLTIIRRIILRKNIFHAHRMHAYQIASNERAMSHLLVASIIAALQLIIDLLFITYFSTNATFLILTLLLLAALYLLTIRPGRNTRHRGAVRSR